MKLANAFAIQLLRLYKAVLSPWLPEACRFHPSCSQYARKCFEEWPFSKALSLTLWRLMRCQPFCAGGLDPAPQNSSKENL